MGLSLGHFDLRGGGHERARGWQRLGEASDWCEIPECRLCEQRTPDVLQDSLGVKREKNKRRLN